MASRILVLLTTFPSSDTEASPFLSQPLQKLDVAASPVSEREGAADAQAVQVAEVSCQRANEVLAGNFTECLVEMDRQRDVDAQRLNHAQSLRKGINQGWITFGRDN